MTAPAQTTLSAGPAPVPGARTTVGLLVFPTRPVLNFARLVADLHAALGSLDAGPRDLGWDHDDVALLDIGGSRVGLAIAEGPHPGGIAIAVGVGFGPLQGDARLAERQGAVARLIADRIAARFRPARVEWRESAEPLSADLLDRLHDELAARPEEAVAARPGPATARALPPVPPQSELPRLLAQAEAAMAGRKPAVPAPDGKPAAPRGREARRGSGLGAVPLPAGEAGGAVAAPVAANDQPDLPRPLAPELASVRAALYAGPEDYEGGPSPALRLAAHSLNATLMVVALPVGAAMMTHGLLRGADLKASARAMALCGIGLAALQAWGGMEGIARLVPSI